MSSPHKRGLFLIFIFVSVSAAYSPSLKWRTLKTKRFAIHFHQNEEQIAQNVALQAEEALRKIEDELHSSVKGTIQLVLLDDYDFANGWATPIPTNELTIFLPAPGSETELANYDNWLHLVLTHELTHIVHLDMARGGPRIIRSIFGRTPMGFSVFLPSAFPNLSQPQWLIEGYATFLETKLTTGGRGRSSFLDMFLRSAVVENKLSTLGQLTDWQTSWPGGLIRYLYGVSIYETIADKIRPEAPAKIAYENSGYLYPQFHINSGPQTFGWSYRKIYDIWKSETLSKAVAQEKIIRDAGVTPSHPLTHSGYQTRHPTISPDGSLIAYVDQNADRLVGARIMNRDGSEDRAVISGWIQGAPTWSPDGSELIVSILDFYHSHSIKADLYQYQLRSRRLKRLTKAARAINPNWSLDGKNIVYVKLNGHRQDLNVLNLESKQTTYVSIGSDETQLEGPVWSPDGTKIAYSVWRGGKWDIEIVTLLTGSTEKITNDAAIDSSPFWSRDGKWLLYSSDKTGVTNVYAYSFDDKNNFQVTNVVGGAFDPSLSPDGTMLVYSNYSSHGFDIHISTSYSHQRINKSNGNGVPKAEKSSYVAPISTVSIRSHSYNPIPSLLPRFWMPNFGGGIYIAGFDALLEHYYMAGTYAGADYDLNYINQQFYPYLEIYSWDFRTTAYQTGLPTWIGSGLATRGESFSAWIPFQRYLQSLLLRVGFLSGQIDTERAKREGKTISSTTPENLKGYQAGWIYSNTKRYGFSIAPEEGRTITFDLYKQGPGSGAEQSIHVMSADWNEYLKGLRPHHVFQVGIGGSRSNRSTLGSFQNATLSTSQIKEDSRQNYFKGNKSRSFSSNSIFRFNDSGVLPPIYKPDDGFYERSAFVQTAYALPIMTIEKAPGTGFFFLDRLYGNVFAQGDRYWDKTNTENQNWRTFAGLELTSDWGLSFFLPVTFSVDVQRQLNTGSNWTTHGRIGLSYQF